MRKSEIIKTKNITSYEGGMIFVSVVVPTYNERECIEELIVRLTESMRSANYHAFEIIIVDDNSPDGTANIVESLSSKYPIKLVRRPRKMGLGSAVRDGVRVSRGDFIIVMDADLQHPPEVVPSLVRKLEEGYDIVIASRYVPGGGVEGWPFLRRVISKGATLLAYILLPQSRSIRDPLSGFFGFRKEIIDGVELEPHSFKVLLEILCKSRRRSVYEVPYTFKSRIRGRSKLTLKEMMRYVRHLLRLTNYRILKFVAVGASGIAVNSFILHTLISFGVPAYLASPAAIETSIASNFTLNDVWTFRDVRVGGVMVRFIKYHLSVLIGALVHYVTFLILISFSLHYLIANLLGVFLGFISNYLVASTMVWRT